LRLASRGRTFSGTISRVPEFMSAAGKHSTDLAPRSVIAEICASVSAPAEQTLELDRLRIGVEKGRTGLKLQADGLDKVYEEIAHSDLGASGLVELAKRALEQRRADGEWLYPAMERLRQRLSETNAGRDAAIRHAADEMLGVLGSWVALFQDLHDKLLILADQRRLASGEILRARPVTGDIDYETLTREIMARFPKILAALAK
jgi:hypothetical protein